MHAIRHRRLRIFINNTRLASPRILSRPLFPLLVFENDDITSTDLLFARWQNAVTYLQVMRWPGGYATCVPQASH